MAMVDTVYWLPIWAGLRLKPIVLVLLAPFLYSLSELSQWLCHDDSTINIVVVIIIIIRDQCERVLAR